MSKEEDAFSCLIEKIENGEWAIGGRLPPERSLAGLLGTSRSTVRSVLRILKAQGVVSVRRGSGCYLRSRLGIASCRSGQAPAASSPPDRRDGPDRLEACYVIYPPIAALSAARISAVGLGHLEDCAIGLSRAIFSQNVEAIREETAAFMRILSEGTGNPSLVASMDGLCPGSPSLFRIFFSLEDYERDMVFADYVKVLHALKRRNPDEARLRMEERILRLCRLVEKYEGVECSEFIHQEMEGREVFD